MDQQPDAAAFWERHLEQIAEHERRLALRHDRVGLILALTGGGGAALAAIAMQAAGTWAALGSFADFLAGIGLLLAAVAALVAGAGMAPLEGRSWRPGTLGAWLHDRARVGFQVEAVAGLFPDRGDDWRATLRRANRVRDDLADKLRGALQARDGSPATVAGSPEARRVLAEYLQAALHADLAWWLEPTGSDPAALQVVDARVRRVLWFWSQRQAAEARAEVIRVAVRIGSWAAGFLAAAFVAHALGWWLLAAVPVAAGFLLFRLFLGRSSAF